MDGQPVELPFVLPGGEHLEADIELTMPPDARPGLYPVRAQLASPATMPSRCLRRGARRSRTSPSWSVGTPSEDNEYVYLVGEPKDVEVAAGESARLAVTVGTAAGASLAVEAHLISPWGTWEWIGPAAQGAVLPAAGRWNWGSMSRHRRGCSPANGGR